MIRLTTILFWFRCGQSFLAFVIFAGLTSCSPDDPGHSTETNPAKTAQLLESGTVSHVLANEPDWDLEITLRGGKLRVTISTDGDQRVLIRNRTETKPELRAEEEAKIRESEKQFVRKWLEGKKRYQTKPPTNPLEEHDALLEVADRLERLHEKDAEHLGVLRDLLTVYSQLLAFERESDLGSNLCVLASDKLVDFERRAAPLDSGDQQLVDRTRAWLHFVTHHYPPAAFTGDAATRNSLSIIDQQYFETLESFKIGQLKAEVFSTIGESPDPDLLWDVYHILVGYPNDKNPAHQVGYTLCSQGKGKHQRWYLMGHVLNRSSMIRFFGTERPELLTMKSSVAQHVLSMQSGSAKPQESGGKEGK